VLVGLCNFLRYQDVVSSNRITSACFAYLVSERLKNAVIPVGDGVRELQIAGYSPRVQQRQLSAQFDQEAINDEQFSSFKQA
jgi:hypothetical protein